ncbi:MAG: bifunctional riboflavin kinase/FAD synthetase [Gammaproteobacteria bacterium]
MQLIRGLHNLSGFDDGCVLTIGNFDGIHRGHQAILDRLLHCAEEHNLPSAVMFFDPHPEEIFRPDVAPARLSRFRDKINFLSNYGIEKLILVKFSQSFSQMSHEHFVKDILISKLAVKHLIIGDDFHFGYRRQGNYDYLKAHADEGGYGLENTPTLSLDGVRVSSTYVRQSLAENNLERAKNLLGRPYIISGKVVHGDKRGRTIGFPTANVLLHRKKSPVNGVFAVSVTMTSSPDQPPIYGVANIGTRPTLGGERLQLEVHLYNWDKDIYGAHITVEFVRFIRAEKKFSDFAELQRQIALDSQQAKDVFNI